VTRSPALAIFVRAGIAAGMTVHGYAGGLTPAAEPAAGGAVGFDEMTDLVDVFV
jgi:hypothetical protein